MHDPATSAKGLRREVANRGLLSEQQKQEVATPLDEPILRGLFCTDLKCMLACLDGDELSLPLVDKSHALVAEKRLRFLPEETQIIREEVDRLLGRGMTNPLKWPLAAQVPRVRKKDGTL